jgi:transcriptional regulator with XRE-family HTH domain
MSREKNTETDIFSQRLELLLKNSMIKKNALAKEIGISAQAITEMVKGRSKAAPQTIKQLSKFFQVSEEWLEYGTGEKNKVFEVTTVFMPQNKKAEHTPVAEVILGVTDKLSPEAQNKALEFVTALFIAEQTKEK